MQPGAVFDSDLFHNTLYFTNILSGYDFRYEAAYSSIDASYDPYFFGIILHDGSHTASLSADARGPGPQFGGVINEFDPDGKTWGQQGYWSFEIIPEPSVASLSVVGATVLFVSRKKVLCGR